MPPLTLRTLVVKRASGPSTASAAAAVATLVVDAGVASAEPFSSYSTLPVRPSATSTPTCGPVSPAGSADPSMAASPAAVGSVAGFAPGVLPAVPAATGARTAPGRSMGRAAATG